MRVNDFLVLTVKTARDQLPARRREFHARSRFTFAQIYYARPSIHYEVWVRGKDKFLELGLHFEADRATNAALLDLCAERIFEIKEMLGDKVELEQWTASWTRVHELMPYERLDESTARRAGERLAKMITALQPLIESSPIYGPARSKRAPRKRA